MTTGQIEQALRQAFSMGQVYWQQADSDYTSEHRKSDKTREQFEALVCETLALHTKDKAIHEWEEKHRD